MINAQQLINKINTRLSGGGLTDLQTCQLNNALTALQTNDVILVSTFANLPNAADYTGRMIYVDDVNKYYFSTGFSWEDNFSSDNVPFGFIWGWGCNASGRIGDGTIGARSSPVSVIGGFTDWCQVSAGCHSLAVRRNGTAWSWGDGGGGRLGSGFTINRSSPGSIAGGFTDWCQVSAGHEHSLGVRTNGTAWAWGLNTCGMLGDGTTVSKTSPVSVVGGFTDWCQVSAGGRHSLGLRSNGTLWSWGGAAGNNSLLGDGTTVDKSSPVSVVGGFTDWCQVSAGNVHSLGVRQNGTVWGWGNGSCGQLGNNSTVQMCSPVSVLGGFTDWCQVSAALQGNAVIYGQQSHSIGVRRNGTAWAWGTNDSGQLGDGTTVTKLSPVSVIGGFTDWCQVTSFVGGSHALRTNGTLWSWGTATSGRLGDGTEVLKSSPVLVAGGFTDWCQVDAGFGQILAMRNTQKGLS